MARVGIRGAVVSRAVHPGRFVTFVKPHVQVHPATVLESTELRTGAKYTIAEIPEKRDVYLGTEELQFGSVNAARDFVKAINASAGDTVCRIGRAT